ncbi:MAG: hypothetical protein QOF33_1621, partial [Thermomicrobiales bacterium]|nr:hypothetical protein [Thermomicrobiales bacterium]
MGSPIGRSTQMRSAGPFGPALRFRS